MAKRPGVIARASREVDGGQVPNNYIAAVTAEVRIFWPPTATNAEIAATLDEAIANVRRQIIAARNPE